MITPLAVRRVFTRSTLLPRSSWKRCSCHQNSIICRRQFSNYEIDVQDAPKPSLQPPPDGPSPTKAQQTSLSPSQKRSVEEIAEQLIIAEHKSRIELQDAHGLLIRTCAEAQAILSDNETSSSDEIVATADYVLILMNDDELDISIAKIQTLQRELDEHQSDKLNLFAHDGELSRAVDAMNKLHRILLTTVDSCIPPISSSAEATDDTRNGSVSDDTFYDKERFSSQTVDRAIQLSRRAEDLGMPLHRPLYQRLAMSVVLTSDVQNAVGKHPPIATKLIDLCSCARSALKIPSPIFSLDDPLGVFAAEILTKPLLSLLKQKQWDEAMGLLNGWKEHFGRGEKMILLDMLGEEATLEALEIAKGWVVEDEFGNDVQACRHALELTSLLQDSLELILEERKNTAANLTRMLPNIIYQLDSSADGEEFDSDTSDSEFDDEFDSDDDDDDDWDQSRDSALNAAGDSITMEYNIAEDRDDERQIIAGMSNKEARLRIYLRNRCDWSLPDIVGQLEEWNKGKAISFSPAFERYLGQKMTEDDEDYYD